MERRDRVHHLRLQAGAARGGNGLGEGVGPQALVVHGNVHDRALIGPEDAEGTDIGGRLDEDDIAGVAEDPGDEIEGHLRSGGHHDVVGVRADADLGHHLKDLPAQGRIALTGSVLQRHGPAISDEPGAGLGDRIEGQCGHIRHATGEGDHLGPRRHGEQGPDLRCRHAPGALGVGIDPGVEPRTVVAGAGHGAYAPP